MKSLLDIVTESTKESESPERYFWWSTMAAISAVVKKNVFINRHFYKLYPNIYVALVSSRSGLRKGIPISYAKRWITTVDNTRVISGCSSIQGLINELSMQKTLESGLVINEAQGILLSDEFESFLVEDDHALTYLTALQNTHEHEKSWTKKLKSSPIEELRSPCLTLLVASNEALFDSVVKSKDIEGGFIARTFIVHESKRRSINSLVYKPEIIPDNETIINYLRTISTIKGEFHWTPESGAMYDKWYRVLCSLNIEDRTGSIERLGDQVIKASMLIALSHCNASLEISVEDLELAITKCEQCMPGVKVVSFGNNSGNVEQDAAIPRILKALLSAENQELKRYRILNKTGLDSLVFDRAVETLIQRNTIEQPFRKEGKSDIWYKMNKDAYAKYMEFKKEEVS
jgi:hypothetical protein